VQIIYVGMRGSVFWDIMPCSPLKVNRRFRGTCSLHFQGRRIIEARNQHERRWQTEPTWPNPIYLYGYCAYQRPPLCFSGQSF
jgi:hypothetical protein